MINKKTIIFFLLIVLINIVIIILFTQKYQTQVKKLYIAVVGPGAGEEKTDSEEMRKGIELCIDNAKKEGKLRGKKIELLFFNDQNDRRNASKVASQIVQNNKIILVLGHYYSLSSEVAGAMYKRSGIPAITGSATSDTLTTSNEWYFRTVPNNNSIVIFIANFITRILKKNTVSIIYDKDEYGASLLKNFKTLTKELNIEIKYQWGFDREDKSSQRELKNIISDLRTMQDIGVLFFATHSQEAVQILSSIKFEGTDYTVIGPDSFSSQMFIDSFNNYPLEQSSKGYYTNYIYALSPYLSELGGKESRDFVIEFEKKYSKKPSWVASCYYDAMLMAINSIERIDINDDNDNDNDNFRKIRRNLRDRLANFNDYDKAIDGVTGKLFFDNEGNVRRALSIGFYLNQVLMPSFVQYLPINYDLKNIIENKGIKQNIDDKIVLIDKQFLTDTQIIYVGIDINEISKIDIMNQSYNLDFYLWFRFQGQIDDNNIVFSNSIDQIKLSAPIIRETTKNNITTLTYRIKANFKKNFDLKYYPFDSHSLYISFYNKTKSRTKLIFVPDILSQTPQQLISKNSKIMSQLKGWQFVDLSYYEDIKNLKLSDKITMPYSQFNAEIRINRVDFSIGFKIILPIICLFGILYFVYYIPCEFIAIRIIFLLSIAVVISIYYSKILLYFLGKNLNIEYVFYIIYIQIILAFIISFICYIINKYFINNSTNKIKYFTLFGKILHILIFLLIFIKMYYF